MTNNADGEYCGSRRVASARNSDKICDAFEAVWQHGDRPRIEDFIAQSEDTDSPLVFRELLLLEIDYRRRVHETPASSEYLHRFSDYVLIINEIFRDPDALTTGRNFEQGSGLNGVPQRTGCRDTLAQAIPGVVPPPTSTVDQGMSPRLHHIASSLAEMYLPGATLGRYELLEKIGSGGMGDVFRARQKDVGRFVAIKLIRCDRLMGLDPDHRQTIIDRFKREATAAARLEHDRIVRVYDVGEADGIPFFAMQFVDGPSLSQLIKDGPIDAFRAARFIEAIARAVHHAHNHAILHRDLKPQNILIGEDGQPLVADFGLAKVIEDGTEITATGEVFGTPAYMPPEQARDAASVTVASDVYGLGATLYAALTGRPPFDGPDRLETLRQVLDTDPMPPRNVNPSVDRDLDTVCLKCLEKSPEKRYQSALELADDLRRFLNREPIRARPVRGPEQLWRWCLRRPLTASLAAALIIVSLIGIAGIVTQWRRAEREATAANEQRDVALNQRVVAGQERDRAERNLLTAVDAVDQMLSEVSASQLAGVPQAELVRRALAIKARDFLKGLIEQQTTEAVLQRKLARAIRQLGYLQTGLGELDDAVASFQQAAELYGELAANSPEAVSLQRDLVKAHSDVASVFAQMGNFAEAERAYARAQDLNQSLLERYPDDAAARDFRVAWLHDQAKWQFQAGRKAEAEQAVRAAIALAEEGGNVPSSGREAAEMWANMHYTLAYILRDTGRRDEGKDMLHEAIRVTDALAREPPYRIDIRQRLAAMWNSLGPILRDEGKLDEAEAAYRKAESVFMQLTADFPNMPSPCSDLGDTRRRLAMIADMNQNYADARTLFDQALEGMQTALRLEPKGELTHGRMNSLLFYRTRFLVERRDYRAAAESALEFPKHRGWAMDWHAAARFLAECIAAAEADQTISDIERSSLVRSYAQKGQEFLKEAVKLDYSPKKDPSQTEEGFRQLNQTLDRKAESQ